MYHVSCGNRQRAAAPTVAVSRCFERRASNAGGVQLRYNSCLSHGQRQGSIQKRFVPTHSSPVPLFAVQTTFMMWCLYACLPFQLSSLHCSHLFLSYFTINNEVSHTVSRSFVKDDVLQGGAKCWGSSARHAASRTCWQKPRDFPCQMLKF